MIEACSVPTAEDMQESMHAIFMFHVHHDILFEPMIASAIEERKQDILKHKKTTSSVRLWLMKPVKMKIPIDLQMAADKSWDAYRALCSFDSTPSPAREIVRLAYVEAQHAYDVLERHYLPEFYLAHRDECPGCEWDGRTIFPDGKHSEKYRQAV